MLEHGSIELTNVEQYMIQELFADVKSLSLTRRDPNESGPLLVQTEDATYLIEDKEIKEI